MKWSLFLFNLLCITCIAVDLQVCTVLEAGFTENITEIGNFPTTIVDGTDVVGFDAELRFKVLNETLGLSYNLTAYYSYSELNVRTRNGECDIGWSPFWILASRERCYTDVILDECLPINATQLNRKGHIVQPYPDELLSSSYRCCVDFASNYFPLGMSMLYMNPAPQDTGTSALISAFTSPSFSNALGLLAMVIVVAGHIIWFLESVENPEEFPPRYLKGIGSGFWWAIVTLTTVGYGDKAPRSGGGRVFGAIWMFVGLAVGGIFISTLSSILVQSNEGGASDPVASFVEYSELDLDFPSQRICTYPDTVSEVVYGVSVGNVFAANNFGECLSFLRDGSATAVYMDSPIMIVTLLREENSDILNKYTISVPFRLPDVSIMFPEGNCGCEDDSISGTSTYRSSVSATILDLRETDFYNELIVRYFGNGVTDGLSPNSSSTNSGLNITLILPPTLYLLFYFSLIFCPRLLHKKPQPSQQVIYSLPATPPGATVEMVPRSPSSFSSDTSPRELTRSASRVFTKALSYHLSPFESADAEFAENSANNKPPMAHLDQLNMVLEKLDQLEAKIRRKKRRDSAIAKEAEVQRELLSDDDHEPEAKQEVLIQAGVQSLDDEALDVLLSSSPTHAVPEESSEQSKEQITRRRTSKPPLLPRRKLASKDPPISR